MNQILFLLLLFQLTQLRSQNLILNPGFEKYTCNKWNYSSLENCDNWSSPTEHSPDYFNNACGKINANYPDKNWWGPQLPKKGESYTGIIAYRPNDKEIREYLQVQIADSLKKGITYSVSFYISLSESSELALKSIELYFSSKKIKEKNLEKLKFVPQVKMRIQNDTSQWVRVEQRFIANGKETFLIIGCFEIDPVTIKVKPSRTISNPRKEAYYFIDEVILIEEDKTSKSGG